LALNLIVFYIFEKKNIYINQFGIRDTSRTADVFFIWNKSVSLRDSSGGFLLTIKVEILNFLRYSIHSLENQKCWKIEINIHNK